MPGPAAGPAPRRVGAPWPGPASASSCRRRSARATRAPPAQLQVQAVEDHPLCRSRPAGRRHSPSALPVPRHPRTPISIRSLRQNINAPPNTVTAAPAGRSPALPATPCRPALAPSPSTPCRPAPAPLPPSPPPPQPRPSDLQQRAERRRERGQREAGQQPQHRYADAGHLPRRERDRRGARRPTGVRHNTIRNPPYGVAPTSSCNGSAAARTRRRSEHRQHRATSSSHDRASAGPAASAAISPMCRHRAEPTAPRRRPRPDQDGDLPPRAPDRTSPCCGSRPQRCPERGNRCAICFVGHDARCRQAGQRSRCASTDQASISASRPRRRRAVPRSST